MSKVRISAKIKFGDLEIQSIDQIGRDQFWTGHYHHLTRDQYEAMTDTFPVLVKDKIIDGEAGLFRAATVKFGDLRLTIFTNEVTEADVKMFEDEAMLKDGFIPIED